MKGKFCLIGETLAHSYSAEIHTFLGLDYSLVEIEKNAIKELIGGDYDGFNVTIPYKKDIIPHLKGLTDDALQIGAVNTVIRKSDGYYGDNTDLFGMEYTLEKAGILINGKVVMILGSGGTSLTAKRLCEKNNAKKVIVVSRKGEINYLNYSEQKDVQVVINTTPVGTLADDSELIDLTVFANLEGVFDCVYNPFRTRLILTAQRLGVKSAGGIDMLISQALKSQEKWKVSEFSEQKFKEVYDYIIDAKTNVVLIGMPSCGKTTVAKALKEKTGKQVFDIDEIVYSLEGRTPAEIIETDGENYFRRIESLAVEKVSHMQGVIIATGGGTVLRQENVIKLKKNGRLFYLERELNKLDDKDRPLSRNGAISRLFDERRPIYESVCDKKVSNNGKIEDTVKEILEK